MILFESFKHIDSLCEKYGITNYTINNNGLVDVDGNVDLSNRRLNKLPVNFGTVTGDFRCNSATNGLWNNQLTTLEGSPREVGGTFDCSGNQLTSLEGSPSKVGGYFYCYNNQLTTLEGSPSKVGGDFYCSSNLLTSLEGSPREVGGDFYCRFNKLRTLKGISEIIDGDLSIGGNPIDNIRLLFRNTKQFLELFNDYNFIYNDKIIKARFEQACIEAGIKMPKTIKDYDII
jgi:hypothetical protein